MQRAGRAWEGSSMAIQDAYVERVVDLLDPGMNRLNNMGMD